MTPHPPLTRSTRQLVASAPPQGKAIVTLTRPKNYRLRVPFVTGRRTLRPLQLKGTDGRYLYPPSEIFNCRDRRSRCGSVHSRSDSRTGLSFIALVPLRYPDCPLQTPSPASVILSGVSAEDERKNQT